MTVLAPGQEFAGYRIDRVLHAGDTAAVYLAGNPVLPRRDAVKVFSAELCANPDARKRLLREVETAATLSHPNLVPIYRRGELGAQLWIAMPYLDGGDLDTVAGTAPMDPARAVYLCTEVANALDYLHQRGLVHGGVKPSNILLSVEGSGPERVLLGDFGIARAYAAARPSPATVAYTAPEVLAGAGYDGRADVYSLGCVLFRMLAGHPPCPGGAVALNPELGAVLATATAPDPAARFPTAVAFARAAAAALDAVPGSRVAHRGRRGLIAAAAVTALVAGAGTAAVLMRDRGHDAADPPAVAAPPAPVKVGALRDLLLGVDDVSNAVGATMVVDTARPQLIHDADMDSQPDCAGAFAPGEIAEYRGTGYLGAQYQILKEADTPGIKGIVMASQVLVAFPSTRLADQFRQREATRWAKCNNSTISLNNGQTRLQLTDFQVTDDGVLSIKQSLEAGMGVGCGRTLAVRNNVVADVNVCFSPADMSASRTINSALVARVPH